MALTRNIVVVIGAAFFLGTSVEPSAADVYTSVQGGDWRNGSTWTGGGGVYPAAGDEAWCNHATIYVRTNNACQRLHVGNRVQLDAPLTIGGGDWQPTGLGYMGRGSANGTLSNTGTFTAATSNEMPFYCYVTNSGVFVCGGPGPVSSGSTFHNSGTVLFTNNAAFYLYYSVYYATLNNWNTGVVDLQTDGTNVVGVGLGSPFNNRGTLRKSAGSGVSRLRKVAFNNLDGTVEVQSGTLMLGSAGTSSNGAFEVADGCVLDLTGGNSPNYLGTYTGSGSGVVQFASGQLGTFTDMTVVFTNGFYWRGGTLYRALLRNQALLLMDGSDQKRSFRARFVNEGYIRQSDSGSFFLDGNPSVTIVDNEAGAVYEIMSDGTNIVGEGGYSEFNNRGTLRKGGGSGTSLVSNVYFNNLDGTVEVQSGTLILGNGGTSSNGSFEVAAGSVLDISGGETPTFLGTYTGGGSGVVQFASGELDLTDMTVVFTNGFTWSGGTLDRSTLRNRGVLLLDGTGQKRAYRAAFVNEDTIRHVGFGPLFLDGSPSPSTCYNQTGALYQIEIDGTNVLGDSLSYSIFDNQGTLRKAAGTGTSTFDTVQLQNNGGTVESSSGVLDLFSYTHNSGTIRLSGGDIILPSFTLQAGALEGTGTVTVATLTSAGAVRPGLSAGLLSLNGGYTESGGSLDIELGGTGAGVTHDQLAISGAATLGGTLNVSLISGFVPLPGDRFAILTCGSRSGMFSATNAPALPEGYWIVKYGSTSVELRVATASDTDGDALEDAWENTYFGDLDTSDGADDNQDGDAFTDVEEHIVLTNPTNALLYLKVENIEPAPAGDVFIGVVTSTGVQYRVDRSTNLLDVPVEWNEFTNFPGDGGLMNIPDATGGRRSSFYRLRGHR